MTELATLPRLEQYLELVKDACPGDCNKPFWRAHKPALDELQMQYTTRDEPVAYEPDQDLIRSAGSEIVECRFCHRRWKRDDYERLGVAYRDSDASHLPVLERPRLGHSIEGYGGAA
jgi:hypothetical protein